MAEPDASAPAVPFAAALAASAVTSKNFGSATAARIPRMAITVTNSMIVNPLVFFIRRSLSGSVFLVDYTDDRATLCDAAARARKGAVPRSTGGGWLDAPAEGHGRGLGCPARDYEAQDRRIAPLGGGSRSET